MENKHNIFLIIVLFLVNACSSDKTIIVHKINNEPLKYIVITKFAQDILDEKFNSASNRSFECIIYKNGIAEIKDMRDKRIYCFGGNIYHHTNSRNCFSGSQLKNMNEIKLDMRKGYDSNIYPKYLEFYDCSLAKQQPTPQNRSKH